MLAPYKVTIHFKWKQELQTSGLKIAIPVLLGLFTQS